jgi:hypothetical protein
MPRITSDYDSIYEEVCGDESEVTCEEFENAIEELVDVGLIRDHVDEDTDQVYYTASPDLDWSGCVHLDNPIKKQILLKLIENPKTFFVLYNTQKGKLRIAASEIQQWSDSKSKVVAFVIVDNDKSLADQTTTGLIDSIPDARFFLLSSNTATTVDSVRDYINAYAADVDGEYKMPVIIALPNADQTRKVLTLLRQIQRKVLTHASPLRYGVVFDEADKIYPPIRDRVVIVNDDSVSFKSLLVDNSTALHRLGFVTATEGDLLDAEYPECANAFMYPVDGGSEHYRAFHHEDAKVHIIPHLVKESNDAYAEKVIVGNRQHFWGHSGTGFRKIIVNSSAKTTSMATFAKECVKRDAYAITINMTGVLVYRPGETTFKKYSAKGKKLSKLLYDIYCELGLDTKPLFVIGRRKVDRGLGFHYAPRDGSVGLIFTDMILGRIPDKNTAVQKAGRLAGIIAQCPSYSGSIHYWTDEATAATIRRHNTIVDTANMKKGCSAIQAVAKARAVVPNVQPAPRAPTYKISNATFDSVDAAKKWWKAPESVASEPHDVRLSITKYTIWDDKPEIGKYVRYRGDDLPLLREEEVRSGQWEIGGHITDTTAARVMPVVNTTAQIRYIVIYKPNAVYTPRTSGRESTTSE